MKRKAIICEVQEIQPLLMKIPDAARYMGVSVDFIEKKLLGTGVLKRCLQLGPRMRLVYKSEVDAYLKKNTEYIG